ncbi:MULTISPECIES: proteasome assembly chaperone family protein [Halorussus]|uniref:proteasome assembly chaperone family protein n=1 Tax=Halorussus TaxID=1070314 RepID=UPI000E2156A0|nr:MULTISPECIES: proteasome assembly chaperone family protein [Halorussus]NHN57933.1 proteasome assembly chaperone family protein [Halorussus sp. JP-T4]
MASVTIHDDDVSLDRPALVEGLPGVGLVGKLATDHLVESFGMSYYASIDCEGLPRIAVYEDDSRTLRPPVRLYADESRDLVALQSDVPVSASAAPEFAACVTDWIADREATPVYMSGLPTEKDAAEIPTLYGVATGDAGDRLDEQEISTPRERGAVSGPTGALLYEADARGLDALGLVVESDPQFPDPEAARILIEHGISPLAGVEVPTDDLVERAEEISEQKEQLAQRMQEAETDESSQAQPLRMFQ